MEAFETIGASDPGFMSQFIFLLGPVFPMLMKLLMANNCLFTKLRLTTSTIMDELLTRTRKEKEGAAEEKSIIGLLNMFLEPLMLY
jgi:hypothetical protein